MSEVESELDAAYREMVEKHRAEDEAFRARTGLFKTGEVVTLKSGGPAMTVRGHAGGMLAIREGWSEYVGCDWMDVHGQLHREKFHPDQIKRVE